MIGRPGRSSFETCLVANVAWYWFLVNTGSVNCFSLHSCHQRGTQAPGWPSGASRCVLSSRFLHSAASPCFLPFQCLPHGLEVPIWTSLWERTAAKPGGPSRAGWRMHIRWRTGIRCDPVMSWNIHLETALGASVLQTPEVGGKLCIHAPNGDGATCRRGLGMRFGSA